MARGMRRYLVIHRQGERILDIKVTKGRHAEFAAGAYLDSDDYTREMGPGPKDRLVLTEVNAQGQPVNDPPTLVIFQPVPPRLQWAVKDVTDDE